MIEINEDLIRAITEIANMPKLKKHCEPNISQPLSIEDWQTYRVLTALDLFNEAMAKRVSK